MTTSVWIALGAVIVSLLSLWRAWRSSVAASRSAAAAERTAAINSARRHEELTPELEVTATVTHADRARLSVRFVGPRGLERLDEVTIEILDDRPDREPSLATGVTIEEFRKYIWGPYRFVPGVDGADQVGRQVAPFSLSRGDARPFALEQSMPPSWFTNRENWRAEQAGKVIRLSITCRSGGNEPWRTPTREVPLSSNGPTP